jgi:hypothetical protein
MGNDMKTRTSYEETQIITEIEEKEVYLIGFKGFTEVEVNGKWVSVDKFNEGAELMGVDPIDVGEDSIVSFRQKLAKTIKKTSLDKINIDAAKGRIIINDMVFDYSGLVSEFK